MRRRRGDDGLVWLTRALGFCHSVVDIQDNALGAVLSVFLLVLALDDGEGLHDVVHGVAWGGEGFEEFGGALFLPFIGSTEVEVEEGGVQLGAEQEAAVLVPAKRRAVEAAVTGEGLQVPGSVGKFEDAREEPICQVFCILPSTLSGIVFRIQDWELFNIKIV